MTMAKNGKLHFGIIVIQQRSIRMNKTLLIYIGLQAQNSGCSEAAFVCYQAGNDFYLSKHDGQKCIILVIR